MIKKFNIEVDCANCAAKIETAINEMQDVNNASINFMAQKLILDAPEEHMERLIKEIKKVARRIEPDFEMEC